MEFLDWIYFLDWFFLPLFEEKKNCLCIFRTNVRIQNMNTGSGAEPPQIKKHKTAPIYSITMSNTLRTYFESPRHLVYFASCQVCDVLVMYWKRFLMYGLIMSWNFVGQARLETFQKTIEISLVPIYLPG